MSKTVHYASFYTLHDSIIKQTVQDTYVYSKCPAFKHKNDRVFVGVSPIDFSLSIERRPDGNLLSCEEPDLVTIDDEHLNSPKPVAQLKFPRYLFWTHDDDIWLEQNDHPMTSYSNNFIAVPGWFNLSNWSRALSLGLTVVDEKKPVIIKTGDPLFRVSFYSPNLNEEIILKQEKDTQKVTEMVTTYHETMGRDKRNWRDKLFSQTGTSKCPFSFLY